MPPDTNFGEAWESLCYDLLAADRGAAAVTRLAPPDRGIDIFDQDSREAFQCKAVELGAFGTVATGTSINSLSTAVAHRPGIPWKTYAFATNAPYTGAGREEISKEAERLGLAPVDDVRYLGPEYWASCCERHFDRIKDRLHYRVTVAELEVIEAFRRARYYPRYVDEYEAKISGAGYRVVITNNRTPVEIEIPFSPELSAKNCVDAAKQLLGLSLEWTNFGDLNTSARPSLSLTINGRAQSFPEKLGDLGVKSGDKLQLWIKIVWRDGLRDDAPPPSSLSERLSYLVVVPRSSGGTVEDRAKATIAMKEELIQAAIWQSANRLASGEPLSGV